VNASTILARFKHPQTLLFDADDTLWENKRVHGYGLKSFRKSVLAEKHRQAYSKRVKSKLSRIRDLRPAK